MFFHEKGLVFYTLFYITDEKNMKFHHEEYQESAKKFA